MRESINQIKKPAEKKASFSAVLDNANGKIGYIIAWLFGVPASVLFVIFLIRGH